MMIFGRFSVMLARIPIGIRILALSIAVGGIYTLVRVSPFWGPYGIFFVIGVACFLGGSFAASRVLEREAAAGEKPGEENLGGR